MKKMSFLLILVVLALMASITSVHATPATDAVFKADRIVTARPNQGFNSSYQVAQSTIAVSSETVKSLTSSAGWKETTIMNLTTDTTLYYRMDGSTKTITSIGLPIFPRQTVVEEGNSAIHIQLDAGAANTNNIRTVIRRK